MAEFLLVLGNKNYSSWSLRAWLTLRALGIEFEEKQIFLDTPSALEEKRSHSPAGRVPVLEHRGFAVWDSLAICEYVNEIHPQAGVWPAEQRARARARSLCSEMHSGFFGLRNELPMNCRASKPGAARSAEVESDVRRIEQIWQDTQAEFGDRGGLLFGKFTAADAFFAPVASRFRTYGVAVSGTAQEYADRLLALPAMQEWFEAGAREEPCIAAYDAI